MLIYGPNRRRSCLLHYNYQRPACFLELISPGVPLEGLSEFPPLFAPFSVYLTIVLTVSGHLLCLTFLLYLILMREVALLAQFTH